MRNNTNSPSLNTSSEMPRRFFVSLAAALSIWRPIPHTVVTPSEELEKYDQEDKAAIRDARAAISDSQKTLSSLRSQYGLNTPSH